MQNHKTEHKRKRWFDELFIVKNDDNKILHSKIIETSIDNTKYESFSESEHINKKPSIINEEEHKKTESSSDISIEDDMITSIDDKQEEPLNSPYKYEITFKNINNIDNDKKIYKDENLLYETIWDSDDEEIGKINENLSWTEKYRPKKLEDIIGNKGEIINLKTWLLKVLKKDCNIPLAALIIGECGIGKTSIVYALANELNIKVTEYENISNITALNKKGEYLKGSIVKDGIIPAMMQKVENKMIVLVEQCDTYVGTDIFKPLYMPSKKKNEHYYGLIRPRAIFIQGKKKILSKSGKEVFESINNFTYPNPLILTANEDVKNLKELKKWCLVIRLKSLQINEMTRKLNQICKLENIIPYPLKDEKLSLNEQLELSKTLNLNENYMLLDEKTSKYEWIKLLTQRRRKIINALIIKSKIDNIQSTVNNLISYYSNGDMRRAIITLELCASYIDNNRMIKQKEAQDVIYNFTLSDNTKKNIYENLGIIFDLSLKQKTALLSIFNITISSNQFFDQLVYMNLPTFIMNSNNNNLKIETLEQICDSWSQSDIFNSEMIKNNMFPKNGKEHSTDNIIESDIFNYYYKSLLQPTFAVITI